MVFWIGVPVSKSLFLALKFIRMPHLCDPIFLIACASSRIMYCQLSLWNVFSSETANWYDVMTTWKGDYGERVNFLSVKNFLIVFLCLRVPQ